MNKNAVRTRKYTSVYFKKREEVGILKINAKIKLKSFFSFKIVFLKNVKVNNLENEFEINAN